MSSEDYSPILPGYVSPRVSSWHSSPAYQPTSPTYSVGAPMFLPTPPSYLPPEPSPYTPGLPSYLPTTPLYLPPERSPYTHPWPQYSPATSPTYIPNWTSWTQAMSGSTPDLLLEIPDGVPRFPHELLGVAFSMEVDHAEEESSIPVERLVTTNSIGDGITSQGVEVINNANNAVNTNGVNNELNESRIAGCSCSICYEACTTEGNHRICNLPCGHVYGLSCINKWLQHSESSKKCPQCKRSCTLEDVRMLFVTCQHTDDHETLLKNVLSRMEELWVSSLEVGDHDAFKRKLNRLKKRFFHALEERAHAIDQALQQRVSTGTAR